MIASVPSIAATPILRRRASCSPRSAVETEKSSNLVVLRTPRSVATDDHYEQLHWQVTIFGHFSLVGRLDVRVPWHCELDETIGIIGISRLQVGLQVVGKHRVIDDGETLANAAFQKLDDGIVTRASQHE